MVSNASFNHSSTKFRYYNHTDALNDWIKKVKSKKVLKKRQTKGQDLRIMAVLTTAIVRAEQDLKKKQAERAQKWSQIRLRLSKPVNSDDESEHKKEIDNLWNCELNGLNSFINNLNQIKSPVVR